MDRVHYQRIHSQLDFTVRSRGWLLCATVDGVLIVASYLLVCLGEWPGMVTASIILAVLMFRAFGAMHESVHGILSSRKWTNEILGVVWGGLCFLPYSQWRKGHLEHHFWAGNIEKDPVMKLCLFVKNGGKMPWIVELGWTLWLPVLAIMQQAVFWWNCFLLLGKTRSSLLDFSSVALPLLLWGGVGWLSGATVCLTVILPAVFLYLTLIEIVNFPHHLELPQYDGPTRVSVFDQHEIARSCTYPRWLERWGLMHFNYHVEHHLFPTLPFSQLRQAHVILHPELGTRYNVEAGLVWVLRNRRRRLTDVLYAPQPSRNDTGIQQAS